MKFSQLLISTSKEISNISTSISHILLIRASFIQSVGDSGLYNFLPLGNIVINKIKKVIQEELNKVGAQEVSLSFVTPVSLWEKSARLEKYGKELLRFKDRKNKDFLLAPTHEEMMVSLVSKMVKSYKNLPLNLYQINLKFRDEIRPRFGLIRSREFIMKDGYSFHSSREDMIREFNLMQETYEKIFKRLGLETKIINADSASIGGDTSKEFMVITNSGEDTIIVCDNCNYNSNIESSTSKKKEEEREIPKAKFNKFYTPNISSIEDLRNFFKIDTFFIMKIIAKIAVYGKDKKISLFAIRGCDSLQETKVCKNITADELIDISEKELKDNGLIAGFLGIFKINKNIDIFYDNSLKNAKGLISGANEKDYHYIGLDLNIEDKIFIDIRATKEGDICNNCGSSLKEKKGIEVGHIFQLDTKYSKPLKAEFLNKNGRLEPFFMGTYGIGVSRLMSVIIEQNRDKRGCIWTKETSPFQISIIISNIKDIKQFELGNNLYKELIDMKIEVLLDDRKDRFGTKIADYELLGFPYAMVIGNKLKDGEVEVITRKDLSKKIIKIEDIILYLSKLLF